LNKRGNIDDEFALINQAISDFTSYHSLLVPNGDDAAIYKPTPGQGQIVCVDTMVEEIHFTKNTMTPFQIGYKSVAVNLSDIAAMGGTPRYFLVSIAVSPDWNAEEIIEIYQGMKSLADTWKIDLIGGDTVSSKKGLVVTVTVIGEVEERVKLLRSNAKPGDMLFITGDLGKSAAGLHYLLEPSNILSMESAPSTLIDAHQMPRPHIQEGQILAFFAEDGISLNDVSDGLASEASEIARSSHVSLVITKEQVPLDRELINYASKVGKDPFEWVMQGGEDFILVGTVPSECVQEVQELFKGKDCTFHVIGYVQEGNGEVFIKENGNLHRVHKQGFNHFSQLKE
jgi:thiamine-monophosphate kinase